MQFKLDFADDDSKTGFRLKEFEFYNWGTFNKKIIKLNFNGENALLTGDIGSGKSTIVDAITTLLVPHQKIIYNKAAGVESKERTLYSYIVGEHKSIQDENFQNQKAVALRDSSSFTVLVARFYNEGYAESFTLANFFYLTSNGVAKIFVTSHKELSIKEDFFNFKDVRELKKRLKNREHTEVHDSFKEYAKSFRRAMGVKNEQALNLFYQTVSMKSIGNLTEFIRTHMLESSDIEKEVDELCSNFAELNHAYTLVERARAQIELLTPIAKEGKRYKETLFQREAFDRLKQSLHIYFASFRADILQRRVDELKIELAKSASKEKSLQALIEKDENELLDLRLELQKNGGDRLNALKSMIKTASDNLEEKKRENLAFNALVKSLGYSAVSNEHTFLKVIETLKKEYESINEDEIKVQNGLMFTNISLQKEKERDEELFVEINYLKNNRSNIPKHISSIRDTMAQKLGLDVDALPFAGELIKVTDKEWEGAIERVLHNFGLSLLVDSKHYEKVSDYVERTNLKGKLVYLKVDNTKKAKFLDEVVPDSLLQKIEIKADSAFLHSLDALLHERFDISCVKSLDDFRRYKKALTKEGQIKLSYTKHEKDDRFDIDDRTRWVLGWDNAEKLKEFEKLSLKTKEKLKILERELAQFSQRQKELIKKRDTLRDILKYKNFSQIDWYRYSKEIEELQIEQEEIQKSSDILEVLQKNIEKTTIKIKEQKEKLSALQKEIGSLQKNLEDRELELGNAKLLLENNPLQEELLEHFERLKEEVLSGVKLNLINLTSSQKKMEDYLNRKIRSFDGIIQRSSGKIIEGMGRVLKEFPILSKELDVSLEALDEFEKKLTQLKKDDLPKWKKKFHELLKEKTIQKILFLQTTLEHNASQIKEKISKINDSLSDIEYTQGTYITLTASESKIAEIKQFRADLKRVTSGAIGEDNSYDEEKFKQIKGLIDRFNGREGFIDVDKKWRKVVLDVRNWFDFSAVEKYMSDDSIKEFYAHSGGKSGGQKEKLAYTVLASSLAYQFGLEHKKIQSRSFRFVMIDEAFGRGSDESSRYALRLFEKLKLQLLVITPKQKIHVIEPFVKSVHFVFNKDGMDSNIVSMSIEEYRKRKR